ncbi:hypothetical protein [Streptomyces sp. NPDC087862]|uniref:hypothetical protein n=1 Tax=Streptomyces sp. NPDC087862 TaxID=3365813 RepID=UPI00380463B6
MQMPKFRKITTDGHPAYRFELNGKTYEANRFASGAGAWNVDLIDGKKRTTVVSGKDTRTAAVAAIVDTPQAETTQLDKLADDVAQMNADADKLLADMRVLGSEADKLQAEIAEWGAKVDALTTRTAADFPKGTRVMSPEGRLGTVNGVDIGRVTLPGHSNYGREYVGVNWDAIKGDMGANRRSRPFVDELSPVALLESPRVGERVTYAVGRRTVNATVTRRTNDAGQVGVVDDGDQTGTVRFVSPALLTVQAPNLDELHSEALYENRLRNLLPTVAPHNEGHGAGRVAGTLVDPWTWLRRPVLAADRPVLPVTEPAPGPKCRHGRHLVGGVTGNPIDDCRTARGVEDFGVFNDEGCIYVSGCAVDVANEAVKESEHSEHITWSKLCTEHEEQPAGTCEECNTDTE